MDEPADPVAYAVGKCLEYATRFDSPAAAACDFIALLKMGGAMTDSEIADVLPEAFFKLTRAVKAGFIRIRSF